MAAPITRKILLAALLVGVTFAAYAPVLGNGFVNYDDDLYITNNANVRDGLDADGVAWAFTTFQGANWFPLTRLSWMLDAELFGLDPRGFHVTSLLLHTANAVLLFLVFARMTGAVGASAFVAAVFAVHPLHVESVAWAAARKDVLSGLFAVLALGAYERWCRGHRPRGAYAAVVAMLALGLMAKPTLVVLPFLMLLLDEWPLARLRDPEAPTTWEPSRVRRALVEKLPLFALVAVGGAVTYVAQRSGGTVQSLELYPLDVRVQNALVVGATYVLKTFWPSGLAAFYPHPGTDLPIARVAGAAALLAAVSAGVLLVRRRRPYLAVSWFWFAVGLAPVIGLVQVGQAAMADRYTYLPLIGLTVMVAWGAREAVASRRVLSRVVAGLGAVVVVALAALTADQVRTWRSSVTLFEHALRVTERNHVAHTNLGLALAGEGRLDEATAHLLAALRIAPGSPIANGLLAEARVRQGRLDDARRHFNAALRAEPEKLRWLAGLAAVMLDQEQYRRAESKYREALRIHPESAQLHAGLGLALLNRDRVDEAIASLEEARRLEPGEPLVYEYLGRALQRDGSDAEAVAAFQESLRLGNRNPRLLNNLAWLIATAGPVPTAGPEDAVAYAREAVEITGRDSPALLDTLAVAYAAAGRSEDALRAAREALASAEAKGDAALAAEIRKRIEGYAGAGR
jgi:tetratricopeptide (TPR) repeat protein